MKKLKLDLDDLKVESFETTPEVSNSRGTVVGYGFNTFGRCETFDLLTCFEPCETNTCGHTCANTCANTCGSTCGNTCGATCGSTCGSTCGCPPTDTDTSWVGCSLSSPC